MIRRAAFSFLLAASLVAATCYYIIATLGLARLTGNADGNLIEVIRQPRAPAGAGLADTAALGADPLDQGAVNAVIAARARGTRDISRSVADIDLLRSLGWRSNGALQNMLWRAAVTNDQTLLIDALDALLRRQRLLERVHPILNLMGTDPALRQVLIERLSSRPSWRRYYLMSAAELPNEGQIEGRYTVMRALQRGGDPLTRNEIAPILPKLIGVGRTDRAFVLWRAVAGRVTSPLADTEFRMISVPRAVDELPIPFEWQLNGGEGYFTDASRDEGGSFLSIDWNGRGVPVFASQTTTARAGRYRIDLTGDPPMSSLAARVGFRLTCPGGSVVDFAPVRPGEGTRMILSARSRLRCDFPTLELFGLVQPTTFAEPIRFRTIRLERID